MNAVEDRLRAALQAKSDGLTPCNPPMPSPDSDEVVRLVPVPTSPPSRRSVRVAVAALVAAAVVVTIGVTVFRSSFGTSSVGSLRGRAEIPWSHVGAGWTLIQTNPPSDSADKDRVDELDLINPSGVRYLVMNLTGLPWTLTSWSGNLGKALLIDDGNPQAIGNSVIQLNLHDGQHQEFAVAGTHRTAQYAGPNNSLIVLADGGITIASLDGHHQVTLPGSLPGASQVYASNPVITPDGKLLAVGSDDGGVVVFTMDGKFVRTIPAPAGYRKCQTTGLWSADSAEASCVISDGQSLTANTVIFPLDGKGTSRTVTPDSSPPWQFWTLTGGRLAYLPDGFSGEFARISDDGKLTSIPLPSALNGMQWVAHGAGGSYVSIQFWMDNSAFGVLNFNPFSGKTTVLYPPGTVPGAGPIISAPWNFPPYDPQS